MLRLSVVALFVAVPALAQSVVTLRESTGGRIQVAPGAKVTVPIMIDMTSAGGANVAAVSAGMSWLTSRLAFDSVTASFGTLTPNTSNVASGSLGLSVSGPATTTTVTMANAYFTAAAVSGGTTLVLSPTSATDGASTNILSMLRTLALEVC